MKHNLVLILLLIAGLSLAQSGEKKSFSLSLKDAVNHAIQNNYTAINANRDVEAAKLKKWETTTIGLPQVNGSVGYQNNFRLQKSLIPAEFFGGNPGEFIPVAFGTKHNMNAGLTVTQLLFDGSYLVGLQSAKTYLQISENAKKKTNQELTEMVVNAYGNVLLAEESAAILQKNKTTLEKTLNDTREIFKNGFIEEENVEQLQITLSSVNSALENVKRQRKIALDLLKLVLGIDLEDELVLTDKLDNLTQSNMDLALLKTTFNVDENIDYQISKNLLTSKELLLKLEKSKALPSLGAAYNFGANTFGNTFTMFNQNQQWFSYSNLGISLNVPIFSSFGRSSRTQQAKIALDQAKTQLTETEQKLKLQYESARNDFEFSIEQLGTSKSTLNLAERIENKNQIKFKEGLATSFDLTDAQTQLYSAQQKYLQAMLDVINKKAALEKLTAKN